MMFGQFNSICGFALVSATGAIAETDLLLLSAEVNDHGRLVLTFNRPTEAGCIFATAADNALVLTEINPPINLDITWSEVFDGDDGLSAVTTLDSPSVTVDAGTPLELRYVSGNVVHGSPINDGLGNFLADFDHFPVTNNAP